MNIFLPTRALMAGLSGTATGLLVKKVGMSENVTACRVMQP
jgi:hypothetical protein